MTKCVRLYGESVDVRKREYVNCVEKSKKLNEARLDVGVGRQVRSWHVTVLFLLTTLCYFYLETKIALFRRRLLSLVIRYDCT